MEYIILYIIALFPVLYFDNSKRKDVNNRYLIFEWLCIVCLMGFRYHVGGDSYNYEVFYDEYPTLANASRFDFLGSEFGILWDIFTIICKTISSEFWIQQILVSAFVNISIFTFFKKHVSKYFTAIFIYIILFMFKYNTEILRSSISVAVFLYAFDYLIKKEWARYYILSFAAILFHYEAVLLLFLPLIHLLKNIRINPSSAIIMLAIVYSLIISADVLPFMQSVVAFNDVMSRKIEVNVAKVDGIINIYGFLYNFVVYYFPVCVLIWLRKDRKDIITPFLILYIVFGLLSSRFSHITGRLEDYTIFIVILAFVNQLNIELKSFRRLTLKISMILYVVIVFFIQTLPIFPLVYPYHSIFDPVDEKGRYELYLLKLRNEE